MENGKIIVSKGTTNGVITNVVLDSSKAKNAKSFFSTMIKHLM